MRICVLGDIIIIILASVFPFFIVLCATVQRWIKTVQNYSMWNQRMLCTNVKLGSGCSQSLTLLTGGKVNFSWSMTIPKTGYARCAKIV